MLGAVLDDVRALGRWAPLRLAHEAARRSGAMGAVLTRLARRSNVPEAVPVEPRWAPRPHERDWTAVADGLLRDGAEIFGRPVALEPVPRWHDDEQGGEWPRVPWWKIDLYADPGRDVKYAWELGRHRHLVVLARAAAAAPDGPRYGAVLTAHLADWVASNPPEIGVHWYSNLEVSLRALAWIEILYVAGDTLPPELKTEMARHLYHSGSHIVSNLAYTLSSGRNNHLIGDAVGLLALGRSFPSDRRARRWAGLGRRLLERHVPRQVRPDGSSIEDAIGYRAFVAQLLAAAAEIDRTTASTAAALERTTLHLGRLGAGTRLVPHFGDWDGGSAVVEDPELDPVSAAVRTASRVSGISPPPPVRDGSDTGGGMGRIRRGDWTVYLKAGAGTSHEHADLLSVSVGHGDRWVVGDPGNGSYNRSLSSRDYFRSSIAHDVVRPRGVDQREPHRRFRWKHHPAARLGLPFDAGEFRVAWGLHDAYLRLDPPLRVMRTCLVSDSALVVADWLEEDVPWVLSLPLHPDVEVAGDGTGGPIRLTAEGGPSLVLTTPVPATAVRGSEAPFDGWWADDYDAARPATRLELHGTGGSPIVWALSTAQGPGPRADGAALVGRDFRLVAGRDENGEPMPVVEPV